MSLKIRWPEPIPRAYAAAANCTSELLFRVSTEWRHGRSISTIRQWPEVLLRPSRHRASQYGGHWACPAKDAGRHGRPRPAPGRDGGGHASPLVGAQPSVPTSASGLHAAVIGQITSLKTTMLESQANSNVLSELAARSSGDAPISCSLGCSRRWTSSRPRWSRRSPRDPCRDACGAHGSATLSGVNGLPAAASSAVPSFVACRGRVAADGGGVVRRRCASAADPLGRFPADPTQVSVAGISSGAFMANQLHIAHSAGVMGAGIVAGGLFGCAVDSVTGDGVLALASLAVGPCMSVPSLLKPVTFYGADCHRPRRERLDRSAGQPRSQPRLPVHRAGRHGRQLQDGRTRRRAFIARSACRRRRSRFAIGIYPARAPGIPG